MPSPFFDGLGKTILQIHKDSEQAIFKPQEGTNQPVEVIFNDKHQEIDVDGRPYGAPRPVAWFETGLIEPVYGDVLEINNIEYVVRETKPDGLELTEVILSGP